MKICLIQTDPQLRQENLRILSQVIQTTEADLYVLPELFTIGFDAAAQKRPQAAEQFPTGPTYQHILGLLLDRKSVVVCGMLEQYGSNFYNIAAVVGNGWADRYWQKNPAFTTQGRVLPIGSGEYRKIPFSVQWSAGMMVCHDHFQAAAFFEEYKKRGVSSVVLIADAASRAWIKEFPVHSQQHGLSAVVCNAAGPNGGGSCIINSAGQFARLRTSTAEYDYLPDAPLVATGSL